MALALLIGIRSITVVSINLFDFSMDTVCRVDYDKGEVGTYYPYTSLIKHSKYSYSLCITNYRHEAEMFRLQFDGEKAIKQNESIESGKITIYDDGLSEVKTKAGDHKLNKYKTSVHMSRYHKNFAGAVLNVVSSHGASFRQRASRQYATPDSPISSSKVRSFRAGNEFESPFNHFVGGEKSPSKSASRRRNMNDAEPEPEIRKRINTVSNPSVKHSVDGGAPTPSFKAGIALPKQEAPPVPVKPSRLPNPDRTNPHKSSKDGNFSEESPEIVPMEEDLSREQSHMGPNSKVPSYLTSRIA